MLEVEDGMFIVDDIFSMSLSADMHQKIADADEMICGL